MLAVVIAPCASASRASRLNGTTFSAPICTSGNSLNGTTNCITPSFASTRRTAMRSASLVHDAIAAARAFAAASPPAAWAPRTVMAASHVANRSSGLPAKAWSSPPITKANGTSVSGVIVANGAAAVPKAEGLRDHAIVHLQRDGLISSLAL